VNLSLACHPDARSRAVRGVRAGVRRGRDGVLAVNYVLEGDIDRLRIPPLGTPHIGDRLWQHTCFEIFIARAELSPYHEFNFSPSGAWARYAFEAYRTPRHSHTGVGPGFRDRETPGQTPEGAGFPDASLDPHVSVRRSAGRLELDALVRLDRLAPLDARAALTLALSAVIEDEEGVLSYWALAHPPGKPDFHHPVAFAMDLDEIRD